MNDAISGLETLLKLGEFEGRVSPLDLEQQRMVLLIYSVLLQPISVALVTHTNLDQLRLLRTAAAEQPDTLQAVLDVIDAYIALYTALQKL